MLYQVLSQNKDQPKISQGHPRSADINRDHLRSTKINPDQPRTIKINQGQLRSTKDLTYSNYDLS